MADAQTRRPRSPGALVLLILLAGAWLRWQALLQDLRFTPDEAFFSTFARAAAIKGDWWLSGPLDKTPLALYANALAQVAIGPAELAARLPGTLAGILLLPLLFVLTRDLYRQVAGPTPALTLLLAACSPVLVASTANALTDGPMLTALAGGLWLALRNRPGPAGLLAGVAFACKQQAALALPLLIWGIHRSGPFTWRRALRFGESLAICAAMLLLWDTARPGESVHALAIGNNDPGALAALAALPARLEAWAVHASGLLWPGWPGALLLLTALLPLLRLAGGAGDAVTRRQDLALALFVAAYSLLHLVLAIPLYGRYLLPLAPALFLLSARGLNNGLNAIRRWANLPGRRLRPVILAVLPALLLLQPGRGPDPHAGIDELGAWLAAKPVATVIYDRWLGWQLGFYLGVWHDKRVTWYPEPAPLAHDAKLLCEFGPRYFPAPREKDMTPWLQPLREAGFLVSPALQQDGYQTWQIVPPWREEADCRQRDRDSPD